VLNELFAMTVWAAMAARIAFLAFWLQATKLAPAMRKLRKQLPALSLVLVGFAAVGHAHSLPARETGGTNVQERSGFIAEVRDGISLDEAVARAERQYRARVVRTEVQDEDGRKVYVLKLLSEDGRVITVRIDAATGRMR
jgi:hypothetical protein